jgi:hypothetical protein
MNKQNRRGKAALLETFSWRVLSAGFIGLRADY